MHVGQRKFEILFTISRKLTDPDLQAESSATVMSGQQWKSLPQEARDGIFTGMFR